MPIDVDALGEKVAFVGSNEADPARSRPRKSAAAEGSGKTSQILIMVGDLSNQAARQRTKDIHDVIATPDARRHQRSSTSRPPAGTRIKAQDLMTNWIAAGHKFEAVVANNDDMAIGAIKAMKAAGVGT